MCMFWYENGVQNEIYVQKTAYVGYACFKKIINV